MVVYDKFLREESVLYRDLTMGNPMTNLRNVEYLFRKSRFLRVDPNKRDIAISEFNFREYTIIQNGKQVSNQTFRRDEEAIVIKYYDETKQKRVYLFRSSY